MTKVEGRFEIGDTMFELIDFFEPNEIFVEGTIMLKRGRKMGIRLKKEMVKKLLENKHLIPGELGEFDIVLAGVKIKFGEREIKMIPYIHKLGNNWVVGYGGIKYDWHRRARLARSCEQ
ncbi:MAG: hypothetical protein Q7S78_02165 [Candidatus Azambacteria bacterium]|nr:hypothetical protein [Candidatus Azambacteria bacterium]